MKQFFNIESPFMQVLSKIADIIWINLLTLLLCIPVVTAGAAFTAMHYVCLKIKRGEEGYVTKQYFHSFKENFGQSTLLWLIMLAVYGFLGFDFYILYNSATITNETSWMLWGIVGAALLVTFCTVMIFPVQAKFANPIHKTIRMAFILGCSQLPKTLLILITTIAFPVICVYFYETIFPMFVMFGFSAPAFLAALLYNKTFQKVEDKYLEEHPQEAPVYEDEGIFDDTLEMKLEAEAKERKEKEKEEKRKEWFRKPSGRR